MGWVVYNCVAPYGPWYLGEAGATNVIGEAIVYPTEAAAKAAARRTWGSRAMVLQRREEA